MATCCIFQSVGHWHWTHIPFAKQCKLQLQRDFIIQLAEKLCSAERNYKGRGVPHVLHLKRIHEGAGEDMLLHKRAKFLICQLSNQECNVATVQSLCGTCSGPVCKSFSKCSWIAQHFQHRGQVTRVVFHRFFIAKH